MAAPLRLTCAARRIFLSNANLHLSNSDRFNSFQLLHAAGKHRAVGSENEQNDFYGIAEDSSQPEDRESAHDLATRERKMQKIVSSLARRKKNAEVIVQSSFGQVRLDATAKRKSLQNLDVNQILRNVTQTETSSDAGTKTGSGKTAKRERKPRRGKGAQTERVVDGSDRSDKRTMPVSEPTSSNYFDEQYFGTETAVFQDRNMKEKLDPITHPPACAESAPGDPVSQSRTSRQNIASSDSFVDQTYFQNHTESSISADNLKSTEREGSIQKTISRSSHNVADTDNFIDQTYFPTLTQSTHPRAGHDVNQVVDSVTQSHSSFIDEQYFTNLTSETDCSPGSNTPALSQKEEWSERTPPQEKITSGVSSSNTYNTQTESAKQSVSSDLREADLSFIDQQYFDESDPACSTLDGAVRQYGIDRESLRQQKLNEKTDDASDKWAAEDSNLQDHNSQTKRSLSNMDVQELMQNMDSTKRTQQMREHGRGQESVKRKERSTPDEDRQQDVSAAQTDSRVRRQRSRTAEKVEDSAYDVALNIRKNLRWKIGNEKGREEVPADKLRVLALRQQVPDLHTMPALEVVQLLATSVLFENDDFIAINKPYGLPSHGGPGVRVSVGQLLEPLGHRLDRGRSQFDSLHLVHRLDKETTGAMLLAKNSEVAWQLLGMFRRREVSKTYWTITKGLPKPAEGVIQIPLARKKVQGIYKTVVRPKEYVSQGNIHSRTWSRRDDGSMEAVTEYRMLSERDSMALVECRPLTGIQHQIRAHMAQAVNAPVLGDHKYSHMDRLAPQRLFPEALQKLGIRQAQVRHLPMHLHAKGLLLPEWRGQTNVFIKASLPKHFLHNLKALKIKIPPR